VYIISTTCSVGSKVWVLNGSVCCRSTPLVKHHILGWPDKIHFPKRVLALIFLTGLSRFKGGARSLVTCFYLCWVVQPI
jgi:hypothetical protein